MIWVDRVLEAMEKGNIPPDFSIDLCPPSDNKRKTRNPRTGQIVTDTTVRVWKQHVAATIRQEKLPPFPPPPCVLLYRITFGVINSPKAKAPSHRNRDASNCLKALKDSLYPRVKGKSDDKLVHCWELPTRYGKEQRTECWIVPL